MVLYKGFDTIKDTPSLEGKVILLTGGTAGAGKEAIIHLTKRDPRRIYFTGRNTTAATEITAAYANTTFIPCDLTSLDSIKTAAETFLAKEDRLDVFVANAGVMAIPAGLTKDGFENQFGINHIGNAALLLRLLALMVKTSEEKGSDVRYVAVTSQGYRGHPGNGIDFEKLRTKQDTLPIAKWMRYGQSKLANIIFAKELNRRYPNILGFAIHPGVIQTDLVNKLGVLNRVLIYVTNPQGLITPEQGGVNTVWAVAGKDTKSVVEEGKDVAFWEPVRKVNQGDAMCFDEELSGRLWEWTEGVVGVKAP